MRRGVLYFWIGVAFLLAGGILAAEALQAGSHGACRVAAVRLIWAFVTIGLAYGFLDARGRGRP